METKHTPGPWAIERNGRRRVDISAPEDQCGGYLIASLNTHAPCTDSNAWLIAAAPDLLAALAAIERAACAAINNPLCLAPGIRSILADARAAIAKATGA